MSVALPEIAYPRKSLVVERLPPVTEDEIAFSVFDSIHPPVWLKRLDLPHQRQNVRCLGRRTRCCKRLLDILVASFLLVLTAPIMLLAAITIRVTSPGPVLFTQTRAGLFGEPFRIFKLRTMHIDADRSGPIQARSGDARVTRVGRFLRKMRIDELPQLVNVLRGEMSMVGPRPECIEYLPELAFKVPGYPRRLGLKPGLTGIAQIEGGYANDLDSYRRKVAYDLLYLQHCCVRNDLKILARTVKVVCTGFGAL